MKKKTSYKVIGVMSGTSLDGLDLVFVEFEKDDEKWSFEIKECETLRYSDDWLERLTNVSISGESLVKLDVDFGLYLANSIQKFIQKYGLQPDLIASHGHTIYHQPHLGFTKQIGDGHQLLKVLNISTVFDFRSYDVTLGGQGAPLVPIGDKFLFSEYDYCINLGGIANITENKTIVIAYDICPCNMVLNTLAQQLGHEYDDGGRLAAVGVVNQGLLSELNQVNYYSEKPPKSIGREWVEENIFPLLIKGKLGVNDLLATFTEHVAQQIVNVIQPDAKVLVTGGGAYNHFLIDKLKNKILHSETVVPESKIVEFKEALIFAFLGVKKLRGEVNCLSSVTGAERDSSSGVLLKK